MLTRWVEPLLEDVSLDPKMRFVAGPRQCGKTTVARAILSRHHSDDLLFNWDVPVTRRRHRQDSLFYRPLLKAKPKPWVCFDEIHKQRKWKDLLKGIYDADGDRMNILVTGSARLELFRRAGDSLAGRFFLFRLSPVLLGELLGRTAPPPPSDARDWLEQGIYARGAAPESTESREAMDQILRFGPFPEPLLKATGRFASMWRRNYLDSVVRGDLRDLSRLTDLDLVEALIELLPWRVGAPLSVNSLREDLELAHATVKRMMNHLERLLVTFSLTPYTPKITRPVKREPKVYLYEWSTIEDPAVRFENYVALELLARTQLWTDSGGDEWRLHYVRARDGKETDFLLLRGRRPWCLVECKLGKTAIESHHLRFAKKLGSIPVVQLVRKHGELEAKDRDVVSVSAARLLSA